MKAIKKLYLMKKIGQKKNNLNFEGKFAVFSKIAKFRIFRHFFFALILEFFILNVTF